MRKAWHITRVVLLLASIIVSGYCFAGLRPVSSDNMDTDTRVQLPLGRQVAAVISPAGTWRLRVYIVSYDYEEPDAYRLEVEPTNVFAGASRTIYFGSASGIWKDAPRVDWLDDDHVRFDGYTVDLSGSPVIVPDDPPAPNPEAWTSIVDLMAWSLALAVSLSIVLIAVLCLFLLPYIYVRIRRVRPHSGQ